ncbi:enterochelin esterase [Streptomyces phaeoluteigriseus]|uniref:Enterochelin esterase n=1 Tax=Streptomyces phaeoluteigriseus TaxID=114686 RepID=A0ABY4Z9P3_9ACTN|nr:enterochelin esterase [Streptomyces phaeoluteigriseus]USQ85077.1 enterochelin esterase [Streptomyces phaeoluteigriseus]
MSAPETRATRRGAVDSVRPVRVTGPRIARLLEDLESADDARRKVLTDRFWSEAERLGTPLVEEIDGRPDHRAVTFLWRGHRATRQVLLNANRLADRDHLADSTLEHVPGTDVWHLGLRLRSDHRGSYRMAADVSAKEPPTDPAELQQRLRSLSAHAAADPLNPRRIPTRWSPADGSVFALPDAPAPAPSGTGDGPAGRVERHRVSAATLGGDRDTWVYLPPGHDVADRGPLPVLALSDGDMWFGRLGLDRTLDALVADGSLPPLAVLAPDAVDRDTRWRELGAREPFVTFLADELLPWAAGRWPLTTDPARTVVAGQSLGAVTALHAAHRRPERFGNVLAQSPSLWWRPGLPPPRGPKPPVFGVPWLVARYAASGPRSVAVHLEVGLHEGPMVEHGRALYDALHRAGHRVTRTEFNGGHDYACWHTGLADGLVRLLGV